MQKQEEISKEKRNNNRKDKKKLNRVRFDFVHSLKYPFKKM